MIVNGNAPLVIQMGSIGTGYDLSAATYSPDGRIFQVEYALKAVDHSGCCIGIRTTDGIVLAHEKLLASKLLARRANSRITTIDRHVGFVAAGLVADASHLAARAQEEAESYKDTYRNPIPAAVPCANADDGQTCQRLRLGIHPLLLRPPLWPLRHSGRRR